MQHAGPEALARLEPFLAQVRQLGGLIERKPGTFYRKRDAFLHFHADADAQTFAADVKVGGEWQRHAATTPAEQTDLLGILAAALD